jgi:phosphate uptake regulator
MEYRKLIKFGTNSIIISLPKNWVSKNRLKKGDSVVLDENSHNELLISPHSTKKKIEHRELTIDITNKELPRLEKELISAYINNYAVIKIIGAGLKQKSQALRDMIHNLMALEIMEQTSTSITTKDFLDLENVSLENLLRKMDNVLRSMMADLKLIAKEDLAEHIYQRDNDINRLYFLATRTKRFIAANPIIMKEMQLTTPQLFIIWNAIYHIERIGDRVKEISQLLTKMKNKKKLNQLLSTFAEVERFYLKTMKAHYTNDITLAYDMSGKNKAYTEKMRNLQEEMSNDYPASLIIEKYLNIVGAAHVILRRIYG